jgi:hypothetical protein
MHVAGTAAVQSTEQWEAGFFPASLQLPTAAQHDSGWELLWFKLGVYIGSNHVVCAACLRMIRE